MINVKVTERRRASASDRDHSMFMQMLKQKSTHDPDLNLYGLDLSYFLSNSERNREEWARISSFPWFTLTKKLMKIPSDQQHGIVWKEQASGLITIAPGFEQLYYDPITRQLEHGTRLMLAVEETSGIMEVVYFDSFAQMLFYSKRDFRALPAATHIPGLMWRCRNCDTDYSEEPAKDRPTVCMVSPGPCDVFNHVRDIL